MIPATTTMALGPATQELADYVGASQPRPPHLVPAGHHIADVAQPGATVRSRADRHREPQPRRRGEWRIAHSGN